MDDIIITLTAVNTSNGKNEIIGRICSLKTDYEIVETICMYETFEYTEFMFLLRPIKH